MVNYFEKSRLILELRAFSFLTSDIPLGKLKERIEFDHLHRRVQKGVLDCIFHGAAHRVASNGHVVSSGKGLTHTGKQIWALSENFGGQKTNRTGIVKKGVIPVMVWLEVVKCNNVGSWELEDDFSHGIILVGNVDFVGIKAVLFILRLLNGFRLGVEGGLFGLGVVTNLFKGGEFFKREFTVDENTVGLNGPIVAFGVNHEEVAGLIVTVFDSGGKVSVIPHIGFVGLGEDDSGTDVNLDTVEGLRNVRTGDTVSELGESFVGGHEMNENRFLKEYKTYF